MKLLLKRSLHIHALSSKPACVRPNSMHLLGVWDHPDLTCSSRLLMSTQPLTK